MSMTAENHRTIDLTQQECDALATFVAMIVNDEGFEETYGLNPTQKAAIRRALRKLLGADS